MEEPHWKSFILFDYNSLTSQIIMPGIHKPADNHAEMEKKKLPILNEKAHEWMILYSIEAYRGLIGMKYWPITRCRLAYFDEPVAHGC